MQQATAKSRRERQRATGGVPPADAFQNLPRRKPPNLPGYEQFHEAEQQQAAQKKEARAAESERAAVNSAIKNKGRAVNPVRRRRRRRVVAIAGLLELIVVGLVFSFNVLFKIDTFELEGESPYTLEELVAAFGHQTGENTFGFSAADAEEQIEKALPYVEQIAVRRRLPGTIIFRIAPAAERYYFTQDGHFVVLSAQRKVLRLTEEEPAGLTRLDGLGGLVAVPGLPLSVPGASSVSLRDSAPQVATDLPNVGSASQASGDAIPDSDAQLPDDNSVPPEGTGDEPVATSLHTTGEDLETLLSLLDALDAEGMTEVTWVNAADDLSLQFCWQGRVTVNLGAQGDLGRKLQFVKVLLCDPATAEIGPNERGTLDVSTYPATADKVWFRPE